MNLIDRRKEFENEPWQQGRLLLTNRTRRWSQEEKDRTDANEKKRLYARFSSHDEGKSRVLLWVFEFAEDCEQTVKFHNEQLEKKKTASSNFSVVSRKQHSLIGLVHP